jgi:hypothetical protein
VTGGGPATDDGRNGHDPEPDEDDEEDAPLDAAEAAEGAALAGGDTDESLDERVGTVLEDLDGVTRSRDGELELLAVGGRVFAVVGAEMLEVALDGRVATAALATPDTRPSPRGAGWVAFTPATIDRFALDRAEAWVRYAHRRASGAVRR